MNQAPFFSPLVEDENERVDISNFAASPIMNKFRAAQKTSTVFRNLQNDFIEVANTSSTTALLPQFTQIRDKNFHISSEEPPADIETQNDTIPPHSSIENDCDNDSEIITFREQRQSYGGKAPCRKRIASVADMDEKTDDDEELAPGEGYVTDARNVKVVNEKLYMECKFTGKNKKTVWTWFEESEIKNTAPDLLRVCRSLYYKYAKSYPKNTSAYLLHDKIYPPDNSTILGNSALKASNRKKLRISK